MMQDEKDSLFREIEQTQQQLKESIEVSRELAAKSQRLIEEHRNGLPEQDQR